MSIRRQSRTHFSELLGILKKRAIEPLPVLYTCRFNDLPVPGSKTHPVGDILITRRREQFIHVGRIVVPRRLLFPKHEFISKLFRTVLGLSIIALVRRVLSLRQDIMQLEELDYTLPVVFKLRVEPSGDDAHYVAVRWKLAGQ